MKLGSVVLGIALAAVPMPLAAQQPHRTVAKDSAFNSSSARALLDKYCTTCHNQRRNTAGLDLDALDATRVGTGADVWEKVIRKLRVGSMPPPGMPRPDRATYDTLAGWIETTLDGAALSDPQPGRPVLHRLNRSEYTNAIRDLLALEVDGRALLPADESGFGFDNIADVLSLSPGLLDRYMTAAQKISRLAIGDPTSRPVVTTYTLPEVLVQDDRMSEELPFGSRGGAAIRHYFPLDGEYVVRITLRRAALTDVISGLNRREHLDVRLDGKRIKLFAIGGGASSDGPGGSTPATPQVSLVEYQRSADAALEARFLADAGTRVLGLAFLKKTAETEGVAPTRLPASSISFSADTDLDMSVAGVGIEGPFAATTPDATPSRRRIFICHRNDESCAKTILANLARRAYRRPATKEDIETLVEFYRRGRRERDFDAGIQFALERILVSPEFLFRIERDPASAAPGAAYRIADLELASRLSFFLWSSIPDDELLEVAARGRLKDPAVLARQVRRMLADERAHALVSNFAGQWLHLRNMKMAAPNPQVFPEFDGNLREAFVTETELFLESQLREDRSIPDLLTANYTYLNERLARHYGIANVYGPHFRRVTLPDDRRAGLLGHGSILTVTSYSTRTSPVVRGKWLLENFLGAPPPAPPPNVPALKEDEKGAEPTSVRARLERHRRNPVCAGCHAQMEPLGFALENFDAIGKWRTREGDAPVDASGVLPDGTAFDGPGTFRDAMLRRRTQFVTTVVEKLLTYALGRGLDYRDKPTVRKIVRDAQRREYRWTSIILGIVESAPFRMRRAES